MKNKLLNTAIISAKNAGKFLKENFNKEKKVEQFKDYDIKLKIDKDTQNLIEKIILEKHPDHAIFGEEGIKAKRNSPIRWIIDPIDGTVNYFYGIPHFCISIAVEINQELQIGVIYDPMLDELWTVKKGEKARLNQQEIQPSKRKNMQDCIITVGCSKNAQGLEIGINRFRQVAQKARKTRMMGSAALGMAYIACGRMDAYIEDHISLWDIAAGKLLIEAGGGKVILKEKKENNTFSLAASNGLLDLSNVPSLVADHSKIS